MLYKTVKTYFYFEKLYFDSWNSKATYDIHTHTFLFVSAAWLAVREVFPGVSIKGCVFHWTQAVWRHTQELGLKPAYSQRSSVCNYIRQLLALPFLPAAHVEQTFRHLQTRANTDPLRRLVAYVDRQWMRHSIFDIPSWSVFGNVIRTNNDVEGN